MQKSFLWVIERLKKKSIHQDEKIKFWPPFQVKFIAKYNSSILYFHSSALYFYYICFSQRTILSQLSNFTLHALQQTLIDLNNIIRYYIISLFLLSNCPSKLNKYLKAILFYEPLLRSFSDRNKLYSQKKNRSCSSRTKSGAGCISISR